MMPLTVYSTNNILAIKNGSDPIPGTLVIISTRGTYILFPDPNYVAGPFTIKYYIADNNGEVHVDCYVNEVYNNVTVIVPGSATI